MKSLRSAKLWAASCAAAALLVLGLVVSGFAAEPTQDPAPAPAPVKVTAGSLVSALSQARADQSEAQAARDAAARSLAEAEAALKLKADASTSADQKLAKAIRKLGAIIVGGTVYEPTADGYRSFTPQPADTVLPDEDPAPDPDPAPDAGK